MRSSHLNSFIEKVMVGGEILLHLALHGSTVAVILNAGVDVSLRSVDSAQTPAIVSNSAAAVGF